MHLCTLKPVSMSGTCRLHTTGYVHHTQCGKHFVFNGLNALHGYVNIQHIVTCIGIHVHKHCLPGVNDISWEAFTASLPLIDPMSSKHMSCMKPQV